MHPIFIGYGPRFKQNYTHTTAVYAVDIYPLIAELAGFQALNSSGTLKRVEAMLQDSRYQRTWNLIVSFFSRRFMKWNATIIVTRTFIQSKRTDQNSSTKLYEILWCQIEPFGLANWTKKVFPLFPHNIQYRARLKGPPFSFLGIVRLFFSQILFSEGPPSSFLMFCDRMDVEKSQRVPPLASQFVPTFWVFFLMRIIALQFFDVLQQRMLKNPKGSSLLALQFCPTFGFFKYCKRILDTLKSFCYFWALDMASTYAVPGLLLILVVLLGFLSKPVIFSWRDLIWSEFQVSGVWWLYRSLKYFQK